jgi:hypothetical protein
VMGLQAEFTPYSCPVDQIMEVLEGLTRKAVQISVKKNKQAPDDSCPGRIGEDLARIWATCTRMIMGEPDKLDPVLRDRIVERYFRFMFASGWETSEILYSNAQRCCEPHLLAGQIAHRDQASTWKSADATRDGHEGDPKKTRLWQVVHH